MIVILKALLRQRLSFILLFFVPILLIVGFLLLFQLTADEVKIRVFIVDNEEQPLVEEVILHLEQVEVFEVLKGKDVPWDLLERGEIEAAFSFDPQLEERIYTGDVDELITWYRHEQSIFDGFIKEQIASHLMGYIVRAVGANIVDQYEGSSDWEEVFEYGLRFLAPTPIFTMNFQSFHAYGNMDDEASNNSSIRLLMWIYGAIMISLFAQKLLTWKRDEIFKRFALVSYGILRIRLLWLFIVSIITSFVLAIMMNVIHFSIYTELYSFNELIMDVIIVIATALFVLGLTIILNKKETFLAWMILYIVFSTVLFIFLDNYMLEPSWWTYLFIPTWILV